MENITYQQLLEELQTLSKEQLLQTVTVFFADKDEYVPVRSVSVAVETDVVDSGHIVLATAESEF